MPLLRRASTEKKIGDGVGRRCRGSFFLDGEFVASNGRRQSFARGANEARNWRRTTEGPPIQFRRKPQPLCPIIATSSMPPANLPVVLCPAKTSSVVISRLQPSPAPKSRHKDHLHYHVNLFFQSRSLAHRLLPQSRSPFFHCSPPTSTNRQSFPSVNPDPPSKTLTTAQFTFPNQNLLLAGAASVEDSGATLLTNSTTDLSLARRAFFPSPIRFPI
ncbi:lectin-domain containing receptor kinase A4.2 [Striga asiatica]|uniref:Lectin-domain containing receptor kinase A4.2 n=1 Tax=Striga asiatica TaxID=4170 RepID=A0A5A7P123_STRAF|nr:lectin-domain containing receptor kinase A4.2 [Striga asiatica]